jgi:cytochrome bd-type quinol oxidase subunit 2
VALAVAVGASDPRAVERTTLLLLCGAVLVALYAFATKALPGLSLGPLDLDQSSGLSRLRAPLGYWNAVALVCALALPAAVRVACDTSRRERQRAAALAAALLLVCVIGLTYSRGGLIAVVTAAAVLTALGGARLRGLIVLGGVGLAGAPVLAVAFTRPGLSSNGAELAARESDGLILLVAFAVCLVLLVAAALGWWRVERGSPGAPLARGRCSGRLRRSRRSESSSRSRRPRSPTAACPGRCPTACARSPSRAATTRSTPDGS